jgi:hypothetical protein
MAVKEDGPETEVVLFAARPVCHRVLFATESCLPQSQGFVPRALGLWLNRNFHGELTTKRQMEIEMKREMKRI